MLIRLDSYRNNVMEESADRCRTRVCPRPAALIVRSFLCDGYQSPDKDPGFHDLRQKKSKLCRIDNLVVDALDRGRSR